MSNQIGLMLSFIFLAFFIIFSSETISYQQTTAKAMAQTNYIAVYIQENGYDEEDIVLLNQLNNFTDYEITYSTANNNFVAYHITTKKKYIAFSEIFEYMSTDIVCEMIVYRKE